MRVLYKWIYLLPLGLLITKVLLNLSISQTFILKLCKERLKEYQLSKLQVTWSHWQFTKFFAKKLIKSLYIQGKQKYWLELSQLQFSGWRINIGSHFISEWELELILSTLQKLLILELVYQSALHYRNFLPLYVFDILKLTKITLVAETF